MSAAGSGPASPLIVALDFSAEAGALALVEKLRGVPVGMFKVGLELFTAAGPRIVERVRESGHHVFLDLKFHDIPNTVAGAVRSAARLGASVLNVHAGGGLEMMRAAAAAGRDAGTRVIAVTVLTALGDSDLQAIGFRAGSARDHVLRLAEMAANAGLDGVVASPEEAAALRARFPRPFLIITPGVRPAAADAADDQKRVATPEAAVRAGADYIVVGRPILRAPDPAAAARSILAELPSFHSGF